jgi:hypothetical protein
MASGPKRASNINSDHHQEKNSDHHQEKNLGQRDQKDQSQ